MKRQLFILAICFILFVVPESFAVLINSATIICFSLFISFVASFLLFLVLILFKIFEFEFNFTLLHGLITGMIVMVGLFFLDFSIYDKGYPCWQIYLGFIIGFAFGINISFRLASFINTKVLLKNN